MSNDPYRGGSHLPDIALFRPIFYDDKLIAFAGCIIHYTDVGGMAPGSNPVQATELYQEGLVIPPVKLADAGRENKTLLDLIRANVRGPDIFMGDLRAQEGALLKGEQRLRDLLDRYGFDGVSHAMELLIDYAEKKACAAVREIPNGAYEFSDYMDHDGVDLSKPIGIRVRLTVHDELLHFDFTGTDAQVKGPLNAPLSKTWTTVFYCVRYELAPDSGGSGKCRGGLGIVREYEMLAESASVNVRGDRAAFAPRGLYNGGNGSFSSFYLETQNGQMEKIPSKFGSRILRGQRLKIMTPGGGGFGEPHERTRGAIVSDYREGKTSAEKIKLDYGVDVLAEDGS